MKLFLLAIIYFFSLQYVFCQEDTSYINKLNSESWNYRYKNIDSALLLANKALKLSNEINYSEGKATSFNNLGVVNRRMGNYDSSIHYFTLALEIEKKSKSLKPQLGKTYNNLGLVYLDLANYEKSIYYFLESEKIFTNINNEKGKAGCLVNIGLINYFQRKFDASQRDYKEAITIYKKLNEWRLIAIVYNNIGNVHQEEKRYDSARYYFEKSLEHYTKIGDKYGISVQISNIGVVLILENKNEEALDYQLKAFEIKKELKDKKGIAETTIHLANLYRKLKRYDEAFTYFQKGITLSKEIGAYENIKSAVHHLAIFYSELGDYKNEAYYYKRYIDLNDSLLSVENNKIISEMEAKYHNEQKAKEIELLKKEQELKDHQIEKQLLANSLLIGGVVSLILIALLIYWRYSAGIKAKKIISDQNEKLQEKNTHILDSIRYAKRIQEAILPDLKCIQNLQIETFILYMPKEIVSGDFYWLEYVEQNNELLISAVDCTGHGVPGAFMSIIGNNGLNKALKEEKLTQPSLILDSLNEFVLDSMHKNAEKYVKDGMDIALCKINFSESNLMFSGGRNPLYIVSSDLNKFHEQPVIQKDKYALIEIKANKYSIGENHPPFTNHSFQISEKDSIYIFTDGFADQFGGEKNKKYTYKKLKNKLLEIQSESMENQKKALIDELNQWKGEFEQLDDICIIGMKLKK